MKTAVSFLELFGSINKSKMLKYKVIFFRNNVIVVSIPRKGVKTTYGLTNSIYELCLQWPLKKWSIFLCPKHLCSISSTDNNYNKIITFKKIHFDIEDYPQIRTPLNSNSSGLGDNTQNYCWLHSSVPVIKPICVK